MEGKRFDILKSNRHYTELEPEVAKITAKRKKEKEQLKIEKVRRR